MIAGKDSQLANLEARVRRLEQGADETLVSSLQSSYQTLGGDGIIRNSFPLVYVAPPPSGGDDTATIQAMIDLSIASGGGTIGWQPGNYIHNGVPTFRNTSLAIISQGTGGANSGQGSATTFTYTGSDVRGWDVTGTVGITIRDQQIIQNNPAFIGKLIDYSSSQQGIIEGCFIGGIQSLGANSATPLVSFNNSDDMRISTCTVGACAVGVRGRDSSGNFSNSVLLDHVTFQLGLVRGADVANAGQSWKMDTCTFEALASGACKAYATSGSGVGLVTSESLTFINCWFGDVTADAVVPATNSWIDWAGNGLTLIGNTISGHRNTEAGSCAIKLLAPSCQGITLLGNTLSSMISGLADEGGGNHRAVFLEPNSWGDLQLKTGDGSGGGQLSYFGSSSRAHVNAATTIAASAGGAFTQIPLDTIDGDVGSEFSRGLPAYKVNNPGNYSIKAQLQLTVNGGGTAIQVGAFIAVNGTIVATGSQLFGVTGAGLSVSADVTHLNQGDLIQLYVFYKSANSAALNVGSSITNYLHVTPMVFPLATE